MATELYGWPWTKAAIATRMRRARLSNEGSLPRHDYTVPWTVHNEHSHDETVIQLRALGRRLRGLPLTPRTEKRLDAWLQRLDLRNQVVHYSPVDGWKYVDRDTVPEHYLHPDPRVPILPPEAKHLELAKRRAEAVKADTVKSSRRLAALQDVEESQRAG
ncbi:hypothetical protein [Jiangella anatolica]|nr:hypothetical protein [Jiangella anatolica]